MRDNLLINPLYDILSANSPHAINQRNREVRCNWLFLVAYMRMEGFLSVYRRRQHRAWRFRGFATRQRAEAVLVNRMVGRSYDAEWFHSMQTRLEPGDGRGRRYNRYVMGMAPYATNARVFAWGDRSWDHQKPWAPVPRQVSFIAFSQPLCSKSVCLQKLVEVASRNHIVLMVDEFNTSARTHLTGAGYEHPAAVVPGPPPFNQQVQVIRGSCNHRFDNCKENSCH
jgi:hypothetical protein